jgi:hypothetical protein
VLHMAGGGERLRVRLTNRYGRTPLTIAAATAATEHGQAALTFDGAEKLTIPPGEEAAATVAPGADLFLSLYFPCGDRPGHLFPQAHGDRSHSRREPRHVSRPP